ncbi:MAG: BMP family ABC transporter substrate-binding protein, partial [Lachnospiraceae bacterium]|nr:BMP family ABC transporter substrate-binding protein [Lachnospiraceae bacterium]
MEQYVKALRSGEKEYHSYQYRGLYPYPPSLEDILPDYSRCSTESLGVVHIPSERLVGTTTNARKNAFAPNFMPLLPADTEFATKWITLCHAHEEEGIREPVVVYEYMNYYYVTEGNKRVSVLKFFHAPTIPAVVTRILPPKDDSLESRLYYEYVDFYRITKVNFLTLSRPGDYSLLLERLGKSPSHSWSQDETREFHSFCLRFTDAYYHLGGKKLSITVGDAILVFLKIYQEYEQFCFRLTADLQKDLSRIWDDILLRCQNNSAALLMEPSAAPKRKILDRLHPTHSYQLKVAFLHCGNAQTSYWTYTHELGRTYLEQTFGDQLTTSVYQDLTAETAETAIQQAIDDGNTILFITAADLIEPSLMAAINHPHIKVLNCSLNCSHRYIRTYYGRMYEAMFLT